MRVTSFGEDGRVTIYQPDAGHVAADHLGGAASVVSSPPYNTGITARRVPRRCFRFEEEPTEGVA